MNSLSKEELESCSELYSNHYGVYDNNSPFRPGERIRLKSSYYKDKYQKDNFYIALAEYNGHEIAHALYFRKTYENNRTMTWVVQLVVHSDYRKQGIGSKLLHSIWGFSNDYAWGLATSNPFTVKTLEASTFRKADPRIIAQHLDEIKETIGKSINFVREYRVNDNESIVDSNFPVDHSHLDEDIKKVFGSREWKLGKLNCGEEWLAFTFRDQKYSEEFDGSFKNLLKFSEEQLKEAYGRMQIRQPWRKHTQHEVDFIISHCALSNDAIILDFGCGTGRHSIEFAKAGFCVTGIDFSEKNIKEAVKECNAHLKLKFVQADCREYIHNGKADIILALYDVVGSFPDENENVKIIKNAYENLKNDGYFVLSVMNMDLTRYLAKSERVGSIMDNPMILQTLSAGTIMQDSGDVFNPEYYFIDEKTGIVYRKEQFVEGNGLLAEYIIRDKRYTMSELRANLIKTGFEIVDMRFVQAGKWNVKLQGTDNSAKEILAICKKTPKC